MNKSIWAAVFVTLPSLAAAADPSAGSGSGDQWAGCYLGAGGSYVSNGTSTYAFNTYDGGSHTAQGGMFQLRGGCDMQNGQFVFGVVGTMDIGGLSGMNAFYPVGPGFPEYLTTEVDWIGALKARAGVTLTDKLLVYGTAGLAWEHISYSDYDEVPVLSFDGTGDEVRQGYQVGIGAEFQVTDNGRFFLEYTYTDFGSADVTLVDVNPATGWDGSWSNNYTITARALTLGYVYRF